MMGSLQSSEIESFSRVTVYNNYYKGGGVFFVMEDDFKGKDVVVAVSGYFDPVHEGHIEYFNLARKLGDRLVVILNNDLQAERKKGRAFMSEKGRAAVLRALEVVDEVFVSVDKDGSVCESLRRVRPDVFANGGDRFSDEVPEVGVCRELGIKVVDSLGKKIESSSRLVAEFEKSSFVESGDGCRVKKLNIEPGREISLRRHLHRSENFVVISGVARVCLDGEEFVLNKGESVCVSVGEVYRLENPGKILLEVVSVRVGEYLGEDDVERIDKIEDFEASGDFEDEEFCVGPDCGKGLV